MRIYPAIDILNKECVRLKQGDYNEKSIYSNNPVDVAKQWEEQGATMLHIVDLDGARDGYMTPNIEVITKIVKSINIPIQLGGGIRTIEKVEFLLNQGVDRVILGTSAVNDPNFLKTALQRFKEKIVVGIDAKNGFVLVEGWLQNSSRKAIDFGKYVESLGCENIVYTDISKDGMLEGPNLVEMEEMNNALNLNVIASGGVSSIKDILDLKKLKVEGAIIGKALYTNKLSLQEAIKEALEC